MFKLIKINHAKNNCPELVLLNAKEGDAICECGCVVDREGNNATEYIGGEPKYIVAGDYIPERSDMVTVYPVTREMVFEVPIKGDSETIYVGSSVSPASFNDDFRYDSVVLENGGKGRILKIMKHENGVLVEVMFDGR